MHTYPIDIVQFVVYISSNALSRHVIRHLGINVMHVLIRMSRDILMVHVIRIIVYEYVNQIEINNCHPH